MKVSRKQDTVENVQDILLDLGLFDPDSKQFVQLASVVVDLVEAEQAKTDKYKHALVSILAEHLDISFDGPLSKLSLLRLMAIVDTDTRTARDALSPEVKP